MKKELVVTDGYKLMTYSFGKSKNSLLLISGGPGLPCNHLQFRDYHKVYAEKGFRVVTWDQLGCGESDMPIDDSLWTLERFVQETEDVRNALNLEKVHVLGHSWGGIVGLEYCFKYPNFVKSFILSCCATSIAAVQICCDKLKIDLGDNILNQMSLHESNGTTNQNEYQEIIQKLMNKHVCRLKEWPKAEGPSASNMNSKVREKILGPHFLKWTGPLKNWTRTQDLPQLKMPVLIIQGEHDFVTPELSQRAYKKLFNGEIRILKNCSHLPYYEDPAEYEKTILNFITKFNG